MELEIAQQVFPDVLCRVPKSLREVVNESCERGLQNKMYNRIKHLHSDHSFYETSIFHKLTRNGRSIGGIFKDTFPGIVCAWSIPVQFNFLPSGSVKHISRSASPTIISGSLKQSTCENANMRKLYILFRMCFRTKRTHSPGICMRVHAHTHTHTWTHKLTYARAYMH